MTTRKKVLILNQIKINLSGSTNASMNNGGNFLSSLGKDTNTALKDTTSRDSLRNMAISAAAAGLTVGATNYLNTGSVNGVTNGADAANSANTVNTANNLSRAQQIINSAKTSFQEAAISGTSSAAAQSVINGDNFEEALRNQTRNLLINAVGNAIAKEIGNAAHPTDEYGNSLPPTINTATQLALHGTLGCAMGAASSGNCAAGAMGGVVGEMVGSGLRDNVMNGDISKNTAVQISSLAGGLSSIFASGATGANDNKMAEGVWAGSREGSNAAQNNALYIMGNKVKHTDWFSTQAVKDFDLNLGLQATLGHVTGNIGTDGTGLSGELNPSYGIAGYINLKPHNENEFATVSYGIRSGPNVGVIVTDQQHYGLSASFGPAFSLYPLPYNLTIPIPPIEKIRNH